MRLFCHILLIVISGAAFATEITVLHTTDTHGRLAATPEVVAEFKENTTDYTLYIDCGDAIQGNYSACKDRGAAATAALNALGCNVWVTGNHDLDFGLGVFRERQKEFRGASLAGNWTIDGRREAAWKMFELNRVKVAVIGLARADQNERSYHPSYALASESEADALRRIMPEVKAAGADIVILARHAGNFDRVGNLWSLASEFPDIDLVLGGHTHQSEPGTTSSLAFYAQAGKHAESLGVIRIDFDDDARKVAQLSGKLVSLPQPAAARTETPPVATLPVNVVLPERKSTASMLAALGAKAMMAAAKSDAAVFGTKLKNTEFPAAIDEYELFDMFPFEDEVLILDLSRDEFIRLLQEQLDTFRKSSYSPYAAGVSVVAGTDGRITAITPDRPRYSVAVSSFLHIGGNGDFPVAAEFPAKPCGLTVRGAARNYLSANREIAVKPWLRQLR
ncbi:MAG: metallophosphoesterase [Victivallaceae bacterium]